MYVPVKRSDLVFEGQNAAGSRRNDRKLHVPLPDPFHPQHTKPMARLHAEKAFNVHVYI